MVPMYQQTMTHIAERWQAQPTLTIGANSLWGLDFAASGVKGSAECHNLQDEPNRLVWAALERLTRGDCLILAGYANRQLHKVNLNHISGEDLVQQAALAVAIGAHDRLRGRHPQPSDLGNHPAFLNYLRAVIRSFADTQRCLVEATFRHEQWNEESTCMVFQNSLGKDVCEEVAFRDLSESLFVALRAQIPDRLRGILEAWRELRFDCDAIPLQGQHRRLRAELRACAARIIGDLENVFTSTATHLNARQGRNTKL